MILNVQASRAGQENRAVWFASVNHDPVMFVASEVGPVRGVEVYGGSGSCVVLLRNSGGRFDDPNLMIFVFCPGLKITTWEWDL